MKYTTKEDKMTSLKWTREEEGYRSGRYFCQRHHVDDRDYDGGEVWTYWILCIDGDPIEMHRSLALAKQDAERVEAKRIAQTAL